MSQKIVFTLILIVFGLAFAEFAAFITGKYILPDHLLFAPSYKRDREEQIKYYAGYLTIRNPVTGWPLSPAMEHDEMIEMSDTWGDADSGGDPAHRIRYFVPGTVGDGRTARPQRPAQLSGRALCAPACRPRGCRRGTGRRFVPRPVRAAR